ncbi:sphingosine-1-phosphate phosphatase 1 [Melanotaenia boesemani]|uniref:sphingosine-1-phosphate phosphatase 1 n=1 Tax=Melanotaenia boesemani TaxID=1250792 RepID=UPI001C043D2B|nr:sphingosine-1-phosphate phosphatase 1 [Melanotaenia boesemani]
MEEIKKQLRYLQDPHLVARFQGICGVRGTFTSSVSAGSRSSGSRAADRAHSCNNGACHRFSGETESGHSPAMGAGEGENIQTAPGVRRKKADLKVMKTLGRESENPSQNGTTVSAATAGGETVGLDGTVGVDPATARGCHGVAGSGSSDSEGRGAEDSSRARGSTVKPIRKNSLTGESGQEFVIENRFLFYLFTFGTELGNEFFYITFFPFIMWNLDAWVSRRLIMVWVWVMYLGQCTKDVIGWSRPASPPVVKVEMFYNSEYSMPSTHAMSGTAIPFSLFLLTYGRWEYPYILGFSLALCWCVLVCSSRIYMGMHSVLDVIAGVLYSVLILIFFLPVLDLIDGFNLTCRYAPLIIISLHAGLGLFSFTLDTWSTSRGDTAQILGTGAGVALASHVNHLLGLMPDMTPDQLPLTLPAFSASLVGTAMLRQILGVLVLVATRALMKALTIPLVCRVFGVPGGDVRKARQHMEVELPYRYIVYGTVGFNVLFLVPLLFVFLQLS